MRNADLNRPVRSTTTSRQRYGTAIGMAAVLLGLAGMASAQSIPLNYNFNGIVHTGEAGNPDAPSGFRSISDRALRLDGLTGSITPSMTGGTGIAYSIVGTAGALDIVHLGNRSVFWAYEATAPGTSANIGIQPTWDTNPNHTVPQTTVLTSPILLYDNSEIGFLYQISNSGGQFDVVLGFSDLSSVTVTLKAPDWFAQPTVPAAGPGVSRQARLGTVWNATNSNDRATTAPTGERLNITEGVISTAALNAAGFGNVAGRTLTSITFQNATYPANTGRGYAILAASHRGSLVFPPTASGAATPSTTVAGLSTLLTVTVTPGNAPNAITSVNVDASSLGLGTIALSDAGTNGDVTAGDNIFSRTLNLPGNATAGTYTLPYTATDAQNRTATGTISLTLATPPAATDLGTLVTGTNVFDGTLESGTVKWVKFTLASPIDASQSTYLDIDTEGSLLSGNNDTMLGLYTSGGALIVSDDDDGSGFLSQLTFGASNPARPATGNGTAPNGRDGATLAAGTYYLSYSAFQSTFGAATWGVATTATASGSIHINLFTGSVPTGGAPTTFQDLGILSTTPVTATGSLTPASTSWFRFSLDTQIALADRTFLDIDTEGSVIQDTVIGLYRDDGTLITTDNDDGSGTYSQLSYGRGTRPAVGDGVAYNGRDGTVLPAGTYWLAVAENAAAFGGNFIVWRQTGTSTGGVTVHLTRGLVSPVIYGPVVNPTNGSTYYLLDSGRTWTDAESFATTLGGHLASIDDADENEWVRVNVLRFDGADRRAWIGYTDQDFEGSFVWSNGSTSTFTNWNAGEPNNANGNENYAEMLGNGLWNDLANAGAAVGDFAIVEIPGSPTVCISDLNRDGTVDGTDFVLFINSFAIGDVTIDAVADVNADGTIDGNDFVAFINAFALGC